MKISLFIAATIVTGGIIFSPSQKNFKGTWRVHVKESNCADEVIRIKSEYGIWKGTADLPREGKYDQPLLKIISVDDSVYIGMENGQQIKARWNNDSTISGIIEQGDQTAAVSLLKQ